MTSYAWVGVPYFGDVLRLGWVPYFDDVLHWVLVLHFVTSHFTTSDPPFTEAQPTIDKESLT